MTQVHLTNYCDLCGNFVAIQDIYYLGSSVETFRLDRECFAHAVYRVQKRGHAIIDMTPKYKLIQFKFSRYNVGAGYMLKG